MAAKNLNLMRSYWFEILSHVEGSIMGFYLLRIIIMAMIIKIIFYLAPVAVPISTYNRYLPVEPTEKEKLTQQVPPLFCYCYIQVGSYEVAITFTSEV